MKLRDLRTSWGYEFVVCAGMTREAPAARCGFRQRDPGSILQVGVAGCGRDKLGQQPHEFDLLVAVERADIGQHLDKDVLAAAIDVRQGIRRHFVNETHIVHYHSVSERQRGNQNLIDIVLKQHAVEGGPSSTMGAVSRLNRGTPMNIDERFVLTERNNHSNLRRPFRQTHRI